MMMLPSGDHFWYKAQDQDQVVNGWAPGMRLFETRVRQDRFSCNANIFNRHTRKGDDWCGVLGKDGDSRGAANSQPRPCGIYMNTSFWCYFSAALCLCHTINFFRSCPCLFLCNLSRSVIEPPLFASMTLPWVYAPLLTFVRLFHTV